MTNSIKMTIAKNGTKMFYLDGKRISRDKAIEISENADNEMLTNALGANIELKDAQAILIIETKDPLEVGKYREFGWFFANVDDAVNAAKKVAALFGDRFTGARIMGDAEHFDNRTIATVDKAGNVEIKKQIPTYIFTTYQTVTGVNCNGRTEHTDTFATYCKEIGDDDNFTGLYREVTLFDENRLSGWSIKTADGKFIAKGNTEAELQEAFENIKAGNVEASEEIADKTVTFYPNATPKPCTGKLFGYDVCEYHSVKEYISELKITQSAVIMENLFKNKDGSFSYDGWGRKTYYMTDCYREAYYVACDTENVCLDAESTAQLIYVEQQLKNIVNGSDGSEEDIDGDNVFDYLPALDELNDVDIDDDDDDNNNDTQSAAEDFVEEYIFIDAAPVNHIVKVKCTCTIINGEELLTQAGTPRIVRSDKYGAEIQFIANGDIAYYTFDDKNFDRQAEADFFAIMADRGACTIEPDEPEPVAMSDDISDICKRTSEVAPAEYAINAEEYAREIPQHNPCSQIKQFFIGDTENHRAELVTFEGDRWEIIKSNYYGAKMYNGTDNKIHFIVGEFYDDTTGKYFPEPERGMNTTDADEFFSIMQERGACTIDNPVPEIDPDEYAISEAAMEVAINAEWHNAKVASGNYSLDINGEYVRFENHSIIRIDAMRKMNWIYDHTGKNKIFRYGNRKSSAAKVIDMYMNGERADEQGKYFHEFFDQYCKTYGDIVVLVELTYADGREHHFMAEFNQGRLADKFIADATGGGVAPD